jgi:uncharacterized membrane protein YgdD (TMEM256/DUF423 family)
MNRTILLPAFALGFLAVAIGAFGAHALKPHMDSYQQSIFETGSKYHFYHALAIIAVALLLQKHYAQYAAYCFIAGIILFSGSLYLLALKNFLQIEHWKFLGPITPLGGLFLLAGWAIGFWAIIKNKIFAA